MQPTDYIEVVELVHRLSEFRECLLLYENPVKRLINSLIVKSLYIAEIGLHQVEVTLLREEANSSVVVETSGEYGEEIVKEHRLVVEVEL